MAVARITLSKSNQDDGLSPPMKKRRVVKCSRAEYVCRFTRKKSATEEYSHGISWERCSLLGKGGYGSVFFAEIKKPVNQEKKQETVLPSQIAVKSVVMEDCFSLMYEKQILDDLAGCPCVLKCYGDEVTELNGQKIYNLLLEYCSGLSLEHHIKRSCVGLPESHVRHYTRDMVRGLKYIHSRGYVHCDIKPANILLVPEENRSESFMAKLADFGLATTMQEEEEFPGCGGIRGTYRYVSPELVRDRKVEYAIDIWALGCTVVEMLSGQPVWSDQRNCDVHELLHMIGYSDSVPKIPSNISEEAEDFLGKCLCGSMQRWSAERLLEHPFLSQEI